ncbi:MAG: hypothetical protein HKN41_09935, partial [Ilumatobacter sp.]|nr:hypothetical protein [Ilumatobacter sp.]
MRHHDHTHSVLFDGEALDASERTDELTEQFWGTRGDWSARPDRSSAAPRSTSRDDTTGAIRVIRDGVTAFRPQRRELRDATGQIRRTRAHGGATAVSVTPTLATTRAEATIGQLAAGHFDEPFDPERTAHIDPFDDARHEIDLVDDAVDVAPSSGLGFGAVDPLLARIGVMIVVGVLLVPVALAMRPADAAGGTVEIETPSTAALGAVGEQPTPDTARDADTVSASAIDNQVVVADDGSSTVSADATGATVDPPADEPAATTSDDETATTTAVPASTANDSVGDVTQSVTATSPTGTAGTIDEAATVSATADRVEPDCPQTYAAAPGDSWYRIADAAGVSPAALLTENRATVETVMFPGDEICLPAGATMPSPPSTTAPATTTPASTATTQAPATTTAPTTTAPAGSPGRDASPEEVRAVIRSIFPESQWETAYVIADRESRFDPTAYNGWCCYGVFQIYWNVHKSWLDDLGIDSSDDLFDPV